MLRPRDTYAAAALYRGSLLGFSALLALLLMLAVGPPQPIDANTLTIQDSPRNYAGPPSGCPGADWNCVTPDAFPVHQTGAVNVIVATEPDDCVLENRQEGDSNTFDCTIGDDESERTLALQECGVTQLGDTNVAICKLTHENNGDSSPQCAVQRVDITQDGIDNQLKADLRIIQHLSTGLIQVQDARQVVIANQGASHKNQSDIEQVQIQTATGDATQQFQNAGCNAPAPPTPVEDCAAPGGFPLTHPTTCAFITQEIPAGDSENIAKLKQEVKQQATTTNVVATRQQQGLPTGGNDADIHQSVPATGGVNTEVADQYTQQQLVAPRHATVQQSQYEDPVCCGTRSQDGGRPGQDSEELIGQTITMQAGPNAIQEASAKGVAQTPNGGCWISQNIQIDGAGTSVSVGLPESCPEFAVVSNCTDALDEGEDEVPQPGCETFVTCEEGFSFNEDTGQCEPVFVGSVRTNAA